MPHIDDLTPLRPNMTTSLENLGAEIALPGADPDLVLEVTTRLENDEMKARVLLDYHLGAFKRDPSGKHWNELIAVMAGYQRIKNS